MSMFITLEGIEGSVGEVDLKHFRADFIRQIGGDKYHWLLIDVTQAIDLDNGSFFPDLQGVSKLNPGCLSCIMLK